MFSLNRMFWSPGQNHYYICQEGALLCWVMEVGSMCTRPRPGASQEVGALRHQQVCLDFSPGSAQVSLTYKEGVEQQSRC